MLHSTNQKGGPSAKTRTAQIAVVIRGGGSQGAVIFDCLRSQSQVKNERKEGDIDYYVWDDGHKLHPLFNNITRLFDDNDSGRDDSGGDDSGSDKKSSAAAVAAAKTTSPLSALQEYSSIRVYIAVGDGAIRNKLYLSVQRRFGQDQRVLYPTFVHSSATVSMTSQIQEGCFIGPGAIVNTCARIGKFVLINTKAIVEHDCIIEDFVTLNPSSSLMGCVAVAPFTTIGANAVIRDHCSILSSGTCVGMGAVVVGNIQNPPADGFWAGVPAKPVLWPSTKLDGTEYRDYVEKDGLGNRIRWCFKKPLNKERFMMYLQPSLTAGHLTNDGPLQAILASKIKDLVRAKNSSLLTCSGTAALHALCAAWSLKENRILIWVTQAFTFPSSIQGPLCGSLVADIDPEWLGPSRSFLEEHQSEFDGVIVTNVFGLQTKMLEYERWCTSHEKILLFDNAATPLGFVGTPSASIHDIGNGSIISFHETKPFGRGEGGAVFATQEILPFVHRAMNYGYEIPKGIRIPHRACSNWRMSDLAAASICDHIDFMVTHQWEKRLINLANFAVKELKRYEMELGMPINYPTVISCLFVRHKREQSSGEILKRLHAHNIEAKQYYVPLCKRANAPEAWKLIDATVCLPFHLGLDEADITRMIEIVASG